MQHSLAGKFPTMEIGCLALATWSYIAVAPALVPPTALLGALLLALAVSDVRAFTLPDQLTLAVGVLGIATIAIWDRDLLVWHVLAAGLAGVSLLVVRAIYVAIRGREGLGLGDVKLFAACGAWVGLEGLASVVLLASASALAILLVIRYVEKGELTARSPVPFGAYLAFATWIVWLYGPINLGIG